MRKISCGWIIRLWAIIAIIIGISAGATLADEKMTDGGAAKVISVIDGDTVSLADGRQVRLLGIQAPKLPLGRPNFAAWPFAEQAKDNLERLLLNQDIQLKLGETPSDRHGRVLAHIYANGQWIQQSIIETGMARVYSFADNRLLIEPLLTAEQKARAARRGIWSDPFYAVQSPDSIADAKYSNSYQLIQGVVQNVAEVKRTVYINFGKDWRTDFTAVIPYRSRSLFTKSKIKPKDLIGKTVRVRGWLQDKNGPSIELSHPEQLEILPGRSDD